MSPSPPYPPTPPSPPAATFEEIEAVKQMRTPSQATWLRLAEKTIHLGSPAYPDDSS